MYKFYVLAKKKKIDNFLKSKGSLGISSLSYYHILHRPSLWHRMQSTGPANEYHVNCIIIWHLVAQKPSSILTISMKVPKNSASTSLQSLFLIRSFSRKYCSTMFAKVYYPVFANFKMFDTEFVILYILV